MALTERQVQAQLHSHALEEDAKIIDYFNAVEQLHKLEINKIIPKLKTDARWATVPRRNKPPSKVSVYKLLKGLPLHILGCLITKQPAPSSPHLSSLTDAPLQSTNCYEHVNKAFTLLCTLSEMCVELPPLRENGTMGPDPEFTSELIDAVNLALLAIAGPESDTLTRSSTERHTFSQALCRAEIVPSALRALALITSAHAAPERGHSSSRFHWSAVCEAMFTHPRGATMIDAAFEASRVLIRAVRVALCSTSISGDLVYSLAYAAGGAVELVTALCSAPLFYHSMMTHDPHGSSALRLVLASLAIHDEPLAAPPFSRVSSTPGSSRPVLAATQPPYPTHKGQGAAELLAARGFALLLLLGEYDSPMYLDEVFSGEGTRSLAEQLVGRSAAYVGQVLLRPPSAQFPPATSEGQMAINVLRAAELLSDDSNFRVALIPGLAPTLAQLLAYSDSSRFASMWCLGEEAVSMMGLDSQLLVNSVSKKALETVDKYAAASKEYHAKGLGMGARQVAGLLPELHKMGRHLALERSILLSKLLVNLHYYDETLPAGLKNAFLDALVASILAAARDPKSQAMAMNRAAVNIENLFSVAWEFGPPDALKKIELMAEVDMDQSKDLLAKMKTAVKIVENHPTIKTGAGAGRENGGGMMKLASQNPPDLRHFPQPPASAAPQPLPPVSSVTAAAAAAKSAADAMAAAVDVKAAGSEARRTAPEVNKIQYSPPVHNSNGAAVSPQAQLLQQLSIGYNMHRQQQQQQQQQQGRLPPPQFCPDVPADDDGGGTRPPPPPEKGIKTAQQAVDKATFADIKNAAMAHMQALHRQQQLMQVAAAQHVMRRQQQQQQQQAQQLQQRRHDEASNQQEKAPEGALQEPRPPPQGGD
ncbi:hypothetical protein Ndes2437B_g06152 [Nannochloris sp. 'desiccata']